MNSEKALKRMINLGDFIKLLKVQFGVNSWKSTYKGGESIKEVRKIYEKFRNGCETEFDNEKVKAFMYCGASYEGVTIPQLCPNCQEINKIYFAILGNNNGGRYE